MTVGEYKKFYRAHVNEFLQVSEEFRNAGYYRSSHQNLRGDRDALRRLTRLSYPGRRGLDAGCGPGVDVMYLFSEGYDMWGIDAVEENIQVAKKCYPAIADRLFVADLQETLPFDSESFDFIICNAVLQHIEPTITTNVVLPEFARLLRLGGVLQLIFKIGEGIVNVFDRDYGVTRQFQLYHEASVLAALEEHGLSLINADAHHELGGLMYIGDPRGVEHCLLFAGK